MQQDARGVNFPPRPSASEASNDGNCTTNSLHNEARVEPPPSPLASGTVGGQTDRRLLHNFEGEGCGATALYSLPTYAGVGREALGS